MSAATLPGAVRDTVWLMAMVGAGAGVLGLVAAWLVSHFEFFGRRWFEWLFVLPLAVPTYLSAYAWVEMADATGPVQQAVRALTGASSVRDYWFPDIRTTPGAAFVMSLVLYPYVYLSVRSFFLTQSGAMRAAARTLGATSWRTFSTVTLPLSRPALIVGVTLALMEVINDLGAVQYFGVNSLTAVIYSTWINRSSFGGAAQLAVAIIVIIGGLILLEQFARRQRAYLSSRDTQLPPAREKLGPGLSLAAFGFSTAVVGLGFGVPFGVFAASAMRQLTRGGLPETVWGALGNTLWLGGWGALICVVLGYYSSLAASGRPGRIGREMLRLSTLGYAVPGTVLALGLIVPLGLADRLLNESTRALFGVTPGLVLSGTMAAVLYAYAVRFLAVSHSTLEAARKRRGNSLIDAARVLGAPKFKVLRTIDLPTLSPAIIVAATLVFVEGVKELPATLLLRPLGVETLATLVYADASAGLFDRAALPALFIVLAGLVPVLAANQLTARRAH